MPPHEDVTQLSHDYHMINHMTTYLLRYSLHGL